MLRNMEESVAPPGWTPRPLPAAPVGGRSSILLPPVALPGDPELPEIALRARVNAAVLDWLLVALVAGIAMGATGVNPATRAGTALALYLAIHLGYHLAFESALGGGQTLGKRRYGVKVVRIDDGTQPRFGQVGLRSLLRLFDGLPGLYATGLINMTRTGPRRRQRIGDVVAGTTVVPAREPQRLLRAPGWLLPTLTVVSVLLAGVGIVARVEAGSGAQERFRADFVRGCTASGQTAAGCGCLYQRLHDAGYRSTPQWQALDRRIALAAFQRDPALLPPEYVAAVRACAPQLGAAPAG
jgi:uncharacterized RDD family membrane protein YckC